MISIASSLPNWFLIICLLRLVFFVCLFISFIYLEIQKSYGYYAVRNFIF